MQCHFCGDEAHVGVEHDGVTVGVCEEHFREQVEALANAESLREVTTDRYRVE